MDSDVLAAGVSSDTRPFFVDLVDTPAFVFDEGEVAAAARLVGEALAGTSGRFLYALKALGSADVLRVLRGRVDGFAASSLFEAELARSVLGESGSVHITTPGLRSDEIPRLGQLCDYMALNSLSQLERFGGTVGPPSIGLRINPGLSFVKDDRFNPCGARSKLGVPMRDLVRATTEHPGLLADLEGIHFHSNCDAKSFEPLLKTVRRVAKNLDHVLRRVSWVNLGGGYLFTSKSDVEPLRAAISLLTERYDVDVFIEPGASVVRSAGCLVSSVIDLARIDGETLAFLDTTVNHMPEVYEYQYEPDVVGDARKRRHHYKGKHHYRLVGSTCLAGDTFGQYAFDAPLEIGSRVVFPDMGAYTLAKAHMFNGINLPTIYSVTEEHELIVRKRFSYRDFLESCGGTTDVCL